jgi:hypothetical protein
VVRVEVWLAIAAAFSSEPLFFKYDAGRPEGVIADQRLDAGAGRPWSGALAWRRGVVVSWPVTRPKQRPLGIPGNPVAVHSLRRLQNWPADTFNRVNRAYDFLIQVIICKIGPPNIAFESSARLRV